MTSDSDTLRWARRTTTSRVTDAPVDPHCILIVDDEEPVRRFASRVLQNAGYQTLVAADGRAALDLAAGRDRLDLVLTDLAMPDMSGDELAHLLRARDPDLKVLYFTGYSDRLFTKKGTLWDGEAFLDKPCGTEALLEAVALLLFGHLLAPPGDSR
jgi:two-component system cell cycle sensor histidine kinase/response regulator CckA